MTRNQNTVRDRSLMTAITLAVAAFVGPVAAGQDDKITMRDGSEKTGRVEDYDYKLLKLKLKESASTSLKSEEVAAVEYKAQPKDYLDGQSEHQRGKFAEAAAKYRAVIDNKQVRRPIRQEAFFHAAQSEFAASMPADGVKTLRAMLADGEFPLSRYIEQAQAQIIAASAPADALAFVDSELSRMAKVPESTKITDRLKLARCRILVAKGSLDEAKVAATALANGTGGGAGEAKVVLGDIAMAENKHADADRLYREALRQKDLSRAARAACHNGIGAVLYEKGKKETKADLIREALLSYLRTVVQFAPVDAGEPTLAYETALFNSADCFRSLAEVGVKGEGAQALKFRSAGLFKRLMTDYPQSTFKADAERLYAKLQQ